MTTDSITVWEVTEPLPKADATAFCQHFKDLFTPFFIRQDTRWIVIRLAREAETLPLSHLRIINRSEIFSSIPSEL